MAVAKHWFQILGVAASEQPDFSRAGGTSVDLVELQLRLLRDESITLDLGRLPDPLTFESLIGILTTAQKSGEDLDDATDPSKRIGGPLEGPANGAQIEQWLAEKIQPDSFEYLVPIRVDVPAGTTWAMLDAAIVAVVNAHPSLRTSIHRVGGQGETEFIQRVHPPVRSSGIVARPASILEDGLAVLLHDDPIAMPSVEGERKCQPVGLIADGRIDSVVLVFHHVAVDDHSLNLIVANLARSLGGAACEAEECSFLEWSASANADTSEDLRWWRERLESVPVDLALEPTKVEHHAPLSSDEVVGMVDREVVDSIDERLREEGVMRSAAAIGILRNVLFDLDLARDDSVAIGTPMSLRDHPAVFGTAGMFLNTVPVTMGRTADLAEIARDLWQTKRHRRASYLEIVEAVSPSRIPGRSTWLDACIGIMETTYASSLSWELLSTGETAFPILLMARWTEDGLIVQCQVQRRFGGETLARRIVEEFVSGLERLADERGWKRVGPSRIAGPRRDRECQTVLDLVARRSAENPETDAIVDVRDGESVDYRRLAFLSDRIAAAILACGGSPRKPVTLLFDHGLELAIAVLGVMKAGGVAMPLPVNTPRARLDRLIELAGGEILLGTTETIAAGDFKGIHGATIEYQKALAAEPAASPEVVVAGRDPAYLLFTSGSTGEPKPVLMPHAALLNLVEFEVDRSSFLGSGRCAQYAAVGFDVSLQEIFGTWARGETLYPVPDRLRGDPTELIEFLERHEISRIHLPPLMARALAGVVSPIPRSIREIICAGEALRIDDAMRARAKASGFRLVNQYGPTETHVVTSIDLGTEPEAWPEFPDIGTPIDGVTVRIEDVSGEPVDWGRSGEIVIEGVAVGLGYLGGAEGGFEAREGTARYRTGDLGRLLPSGRVEFLGRRDGQVKISGFRVEPAEVESALEAIPGVRDSGVVAVVDEGDSKLHAFIVGDDGVSTDQVLRRLGSSLPHWMVPASIMRLASLPKTASGKVDREGLRRIAESEAATGAIRAEAVEDPEIEELCRRVPTLKAFGLLPDRPLSEAGVDSLASIRIQSSLVRDFGVSIPVREILASTPSTILRATVEGLPGDGGRSAETHSASLSATTAAVSAGSDDWRPLNPIVRDVLAKDAMSPAGVFHLAWRIEDPRPLDAEEFRDRLTKLRDKWRNLRSRWSATRGTRTLPPEDCGDFDLTVYSERPCEEVKQQFLHHRIDLELLDPVRAAVWPEATGGHAAMIVIHHVAADGVLAREMIDELLDCGVDEVVRAADPAGRDSDGSLDLEDVGWWITELEARLGESGWPVPEVRTGAEAEQDFASFDDARLNADLEATGRSLSHGRVACGLAAWAVVIGHRLGRDRLVIGVPFAMDSSEGLAANMLPVVIDLEGETVIGVLESIDRQLAAGIEHRRSSFGAILNGMAEDHVHLRPPVDAVLTIDDLVREPTPGILVRWEPTKHSSFQASAVLPQSSACSSFGIESERGFLEGERSESMLARWLHVMRRIVDSLQQGEERRDSIGSIETLTPSMLEELETFGEGEAFDPSERSVLERFDRVLEEHREGIAITDGSESITYSELDAWSRAIAERLIDQGIVAGDPVAIAGIRRISTAAGLLGVLRAGAWFVPIEKDLPPSRKAVQIKACGCRIGLQSDGDACLPESIPEIIDPESCRNHGAADVRRVPESTPVRIDGDSPMYGMFTSGTTGEPRCVVVPHRAVLRLVEDPFFLRLGRDSRVLNAAPLAFDASTIEIWGPLLNGGTVAIWTGHAADLAGIGDFLRRTEVDACWLTTALFNAAVDTLPGFFRSISTVMTGGDVVSVDHVRKVMAQYPELTVVNGYGPTENTVFTSCEVVPPGSPPTGGSLPVGRPIRGTRLRIVDDAGRLVPRGRFGQLVVEGAGLGLGYLGDRGGPDASGGFRSSDGVAVTEYHTGDYARWMPSGVIQFRGRRDHQVKIAGHRIELTAIDQAMRSVPTVRDACSCVLDRDGRQTLAAVAVPAREGAFDLEGIREALAQSLLPWEVPSKIIELDELPITGNGKPDRAEISKRLEAGANVGHPASVARPGDLGDAVLQTVQKMVAPMQIDSTRSLRQQGLDSLDLLRLALELEKVLGRPIHLSDILSDSSVDSIAERVAEDMHRESDPIVTLHPGAAFCRTGVFCIPGVGGTIFSFERMLDGLPSWCPVYGLPYPGISGERKPESRVGDLADVLLESSAAKLPRVPILVGYSFGGFVAFEFARRLIERGHRPVVVAIDAAPASLAMYRGGSGSLRNWKLKLANVLPASLANRVGLNKSFAVRHLRSVVAASFDAIRHYDPEPLDVPVHLLRTRETDFSPFHEMEGLGWEDLTPRVTTDYLSGQHLEVFRVASMEVSQKIREIASRGRRGS